MRHTHAHQYTSLLGNRSGSGQGGSTAARFIRGWTGLENCGNLLTYTLDVGFDGSSAFGFRSILDPTNFGATSYIDAEVDPNNGMYELSVTTADDKVVAIFGNPVNQLPGITVITCTFQDYGDVVLTWDGTSAYTVIDAAFTARLALLNGQRISFDTDIPADIFFLTTESSEIMTTEFGAGLEIE